LVASRAAPGHFRTDERPALPPAPTTPYDLPLWSVPIVARNQLGSFGNATYSIPHRYVAQDVRFKTEIVISLPRNEQT
jgi:hypothetical protein